MGTHTHTCTHTYTDTRVHRYIRTHTDIHAHVDIRVHTHVHTHTQTQRCDEVVVVLLLIGRNLLKVKGVTDFESGVCVRSKKGGYPKMLQRELVIIKLVCRPTVLNTENGTEVGLRRT